VQFGGETEIKRGWVKKQAVQREAGAKERTKGQCEGQDPGDGWGGVNKGNKGSHGGKRSGGRGKSRDYNGGCSTNEVIRPEKIIVMQGLGSKSKKTGAEATKRRESLRQQKKKKRQSA